MTMDTDAIFAIKTSLEFEALALKVFQLQYAKNKVYKSYCDYLNITPNEIKTLKDIPFLPIAFFKSKKIITGTQKTTVIFSSSGTTGGSTSKHYVTDISLYEKSFRNAFELFYGDVSSYCILALLPSYLERSGSSLIHMAHDFINLSKYDESGFYLNNLDELKTTLLQLEAKGVKTLLLGVSFALLDLAEHFGVPLKHTTIMETGGMKGRRKEMIREEMHSFLQEKMGVAQIHSEYGMTELLSQAYSKGNGLFQCPPWMKVLTRDTEDPLSLQNAGKSGGINIIDLANSNSCSFIATQDLGRVYANGSFEVLGRFDHAEIRGCNLMVI